MLRIGITGGISVGKTTVSDIFALLGVPVIDADVIAHELTCVGQPVLSKISQYFGEELLDEKGNLDRKKLKHIIFNHPEKKSWLENLLHPLIIAEIKHQLQVIEAPYCIVAIPLLIEVKDVHAFVDRILVVDVDPDLQVQRAMKRDQLNLTQINKIMQSQVSRQIRLQKADDVIENNGDIASLTHQVKKLHTYYLALASKAT